MKKRNFLLLEIVIAFSLVIFCIIPIFLGPLKLFRNELTQLTRTEKERIAEITFCELKESFFKHEFPEEKIPKFKMKTEKIPLKPFSLNLFHLSKKSIQRAFIVKCAREKQTINGHLYKQLEITIFLDEDSYLFRFPIQMIL